MSENETEIMELEKESSRESRPLSDFEDGPLSEDSKLGESSKTIVNFSDHYKKKPRRHSKHGKSSNAFFNFVHHYKKDFHGVPMNEITKLAAIEWKTLDPTQKSSYKYVVLSRRN